LNNELSRLRNSHSLIQDEDAVTSTLIDPFLHCLVYRRTQVYDAHQPEALRPQPPPSYLSNYFVSQKFAILPTDFSVSITGGVRFLSYINNLDPSETPLYRSIENLLGDFVPLFEHVLTDLHRNNPLPRRIQGHCQYTEWDQPESPEHSDDEDGWSAYERDVRHWVMVSFCLHSIMAFEFNLPSLTPTQHRPIELPDVSPNGYQGGLDSRKYNVDLRGKTLQIVVHVSEIRLVRLKMIYIIGEIISRYLKEPNNPVYPGSPWHVEGMKNERIAACAFYYSSVVSGSIRSYVDFFGNNSNVKLPRKISPTTSLNSGWQ
jgi:Protein of unknown function (DUF4246)